MIHGCFLFCDGCSWVSCLFWTVKLSTVLQKNPPCPESSVFQHVFIFEPFPAMTVWFWDPSFHTEDDWGTQTQLLKRFNHWCSRRKHDALRAGGENFWTGWRYPHFSYFVEIYIYFFHLVLPFGSSMFPGRQIKYNLPWSSNSRSFHPRLLMHRVCFLDVINHD